MPAFSPAFLLESLLLALAAPFLLFPTVWPAGTLLALLLLLFIWLAGLRHLPPTPFNLALLPWTIMLGVSIAVTADPELTLSKATGLLLGLTAWRYLARFGGERPALARGWLLFGLAGAAFVLLGALAADWRVKAPFLARLVALLPAQWLQLPESPEKGVQANQLAGSLMLLFPLLLSLLFVWRRWRPWPRLALLAATLVAALLLLLTQSRSGWLGAVAGLGVLALAWWRLLPPSRGRKLLTWALFLAALAAALFLWRLGPAGLRRIWEEPPSDTVIGTLGTLRFRQEVWRWALAGIGDFPYTGMGLGSFRQAVRRLYPLAVAPGYDIAHAHNIFLQVALDMGLPGLVVYLALLLLAGALAWRVAREDAGMRPWALGLLASLVALHVFGLTDALALGAKPALLFWLALGLLTAMGRRDLRQGSG